MDYDPLENDDFDQDDLERSIQTDIDECGFSPADKTCMLVGTEHCDFICPFNLMELINDKTT